MTWDLLTGEIIGCAIEVHRFLGPGLLESAYAQCLAWELQKADIIFEVEKSMPVKYKGVTVDTGLIF